MQRPRTAVLVALTVLLALVGGGCQLHPERTIVSLSPSATEILFAIGVGDRVVAVDDRSNYPTEAPRKEISGFQPDVEAIAGYRPDIVVLAGDEQDAGGGLIIQKLEKLEIEVVSAPAPADLQKLYEQIEMIGERVSAEKAARKLVAGMRRDLAEVVARTPAPPRELRYYHEVDSTLYTATSKTFVGSVYALFGLRNIADPFDPKGTGFPQLKRADIVAADPELIFLADTNCCAQTRQTVTARPGWRRITAVRTGRVVELDDDIASRWGPRVVRFAEEIGRALSA